MCCALVVRPTLWPLAGAPLKIADLIGCTELDRLYAKAEPAQPVVNPSVANGKAAAANKGKRGQDEIAITLSVREQAFMSGQPWRTYCAPKIVSGPPPPTLDTRQASHLPTRETASTRIASTRLPFAGYHGHVNGATRHAWRVKSTPGPRLRAHHVAKAARF
jgi:hypothetical protein